MPDKIFAEAQRLAEGKLSCECGNQSWKDFLYIQRAAGEASLTVMLAGCKQCGRVYTCDGNQWTNVGGPALPHK